MTLVTIIEILVPFAAFFSFIIVWVIIPLIKFRFKVMDQHTLRIEKQLNEEINRRRIKEDKLFDEQRNLIAQTKVMEAKLDMIGSVVCNGNYKQAFKKE